MSRWSSGFSGRLPEEAGPSRNSNSSFLLAQTLVFNREEYTTALSAQSLTACWLGWAFISWWIIVTNSSNEGIRRNRLVYLVGEFHCPEQGGRHAQPGAGIENKGRVPQDLRRVGHDGRLLQRRRGTRKRPGKVLALDHRTGLLSDLARQRVSVRRIPDQVDRSQIVGAIGGQPDLEQGRGRLAFTEIGLQRARQ